MKKLTVVPMVWANVNGKELYYLKIEGAGEDFTINVGQKTYETATRMLAELKTQTKIEFKDGKEGHVQDKDHKG